LVGVQRVTKVTKGGRSIWFFLQSFVVGDENMVLLVSNGLGKSKEVANSYVLKQSRCPKKILIRKSFK